MIPHGGENLRGEPRDFRIPRTGDRDLAFRGWLLSHAEERGGSPTLTRGVDIDIYLTIRLRLVAHLCRWSLAPHDTMTMTDILAWAHAEQARKAQVDAAAVAAERARRDSVKQLLEPLLAVTVVKKSYLPRNPDSEQYEDYISLAFAYQNKGTKAIRAFQGDATFLDTFGDSIYSAHLKVDLPLVPGQTRREPARIVRVNPFRVAHQRLRDTPLDKMKLVWESTDVVFADGGRLSLTP